jgi:hypothetical protein
MSPQAGSIILFICAFIMTCLGFFRLKNGNRRGVLNLIMAFFFVAFGIAIYLGQ